MKSAVLFIHSRYPKTNVGFYRKLCLGKFKIAVDGGYSFFKQAQIKPDIIIGDFDSLKKESVKGISCLMYPEHKDQTDTELAVRYCIEQRFSTIDIVMPTVGEPDHFLGLVTLLLIPQLSMLKKNKIRARIVNDKCEIILLKNSGRTFTNCKNELLSVVPYGGPIRLTCTGMAFPADGLLINPWQTKGMRNVICSSSAKISIKGTALVVHYWKKIS